MTRSSRARSIAAGRTRADKSSPAMEAETAAASVIEAGSEIKVGLETAVE